MQWKNHIEKVSFSISCKSIDRQITIDESKSQIKIAQLKTVYVFLLRIF